MFTVALFLVAKKWKQPKCPSADTQIDEMRHICIVNTTANKRDESTTICYNFDNDRLSEGSQSHSTTYCMIPFIYSAQNRQIYRDGK